MKIGEIAKSANVNIETIRYYERKELIKRPKKPISGFRNYSEEVLTAVNFIKNAQKIGFSLNEIKDLLSLKIDGSGDCGEVKSIAITKIEEIKAKISALNSMKESLEELTRQCSGVGSTTTCNILNALDDKDLV